MHSSKKITTKTFGEIDFHFYKGYDNDVAQNHPNDGSAGFIVFFVKLKNLSAVPDLNHHYIVVHGIPDVFIGIKDLIREYEKRYSNMVFRVVGGNLERRVFKIDVGNIAEGDVKDYMKKVQDQLKTKPLVNPMTERMSITGRSRP